ncbi:MAG: hypothetical protein ABI205_10685, partial [Gemmatimonadaceae bacterium]
MRPGYVLIYVVLLIALVAALGAAVAPRVVGIEDEAKVATTYRMLVEIDSGIVKFGTVVKRVGTVYPGAIH